MAKFCAPRPCWHRIEKGLWINYIYFHTMKAYDLHSVLSYYFKFPNYDLDIITILSKFSVHIHKLQYAVCKHHSCFLLVPMALFFSIINIK